MFREDVSILVVDDVKTMLVQIKELLTSFGFRKIQTAESGESARRLLETGAYHLLLVDWHMSPVNGFELLKYVRGNDATKNLAFIMVTAEGTKERVVEAIKGGVDDYIIKPLTLEQIQNKVYGVLIKKQVLT